MPAEETMAAEEANFLDSLQTDLQCTGCGEIKQSRLLPCQHLCCLPCLERIFDEVNEVLQQHQPDGTPLPLTEHIDDQKATCPACDLTLTGKPDEYPISRLAEHFRDLKEHLEKLDFNQDICQTAGCQRSVEKQCTRCGCFICYRCRDEPCEGDDDEHVTKDITELMNDSKEAYTTWQQGSKLKLTAMTTQMMQASIDAKRYAETLHDCEEVEIYRKSSDIVPMIEKCTQTMSRLEPQISQLEGELLMMESVINKTTSEIEYIKVAQGLQEYAQNYKKKLGEMTRIIQIRREDWHSPDVFVGGDAQVGLDGNIIVGLQKWMYIVKSTTGEILNQITFEGFEMSSIQCYQNTVVVLLSENRGITLNSCPGCIVVLDENYSEIRRWKTKPARDFVVVDNKVHLADYETGDIIVYDWQTEARLPEIIIRNGECTGLTQYQPSSIVVLDAKYNTVQKYNINKNRFSLVWSQEVIKPHIVGVDEHGLIWIRSNTYTTLTIITRSGRKIQEITDDRLDELEGITGIRVFNGYLWVCSTSGLTRFKLEAA